MSTVVEVDDLSVFSGSTRLLGPVSFRVEAGSTLVIMGETGAGKSLVAQAILGALPGELRSEGHIAINGRRVDGLAPRDRANLWGREIAMLPQEPWRALGPLMRAERQVRETHRYVARRSVDEARACSQADFAALGLTGAERKLPGQLSGGMAQRVAFAAARAGRAPILLADEPTKGLDAERRGRLLTILAEAPKRGATLIAITHDVAVARYLGAELIVLRNGSVIEQGRCEEVFANPSTPYTRELLAADPASWKQAEPNPPGDPVLQGKDLAIARGGRVLLGPISLDLRAGERVAVIGPSGLGKTTLLDTLAGLIRPAKGAVSRASGLGRHAIQKLYQDPPAAFPTHVSLLRNLEDVARVHRTGWSIVETLLKALNIHPSILYRRPDAVSGGELQRVAIARALMLNPRVLLADEPTSRLDPITQHRTLDLIRRLAAERAISVLLVTHDHVLADKWAHRVVPLTAH